jgi:DNA-binding MarR family transcriptional regulator
VHPAGYLDDLVHQRARLGILVIADEVKRAEFTYLQSELGVTAGNLTSHLAVLERAGMVTIEKGYDGRRPRTWVLITGNGRAALWAEVQTLKQLVRSVDHAFGTGPDPNLPTSQ